MPTHTRMGRADISGFTLIELMVSIAVAAILLALAVPSFNDALLGSKLTGYANNMVGSAILARGEAIKRNAIVSVCASSNSSTCASSGGWEQGWIVACTTSDNVNCDPAGTNWLIFQRMPALASGFKMTDAGSKIRLDFQPSGVGSTQAQITVCRATPTVGPQERVISIGATGNTSVARTANGSCS